MLAIVPVMAAVRKVALNAVESGLIQQLYRELLSPYNLTQRQIAYRDSQRWVQTYEPLPLPEQSPALLKRNGTYLIAGDLVEGLGVVYAQALLKEFDAKLILLGRPGLPAPEEWEKWLLTHGPQHGVSQLIRRLQALGQVGETFLWFSGSLADADWVKACVKKGIETFGEITGVFHTGVMGDRASCAITELTDEECDRITRTKIRGIKSLQQALADCSIDFYLLQSSLSSVVGGVGFGAYAAANSYLDTLAAQQNRTATHWLSLNWDACELNPTATEHISLETSPKTSQLMALAMSPEEVWQTTQRALAQAGFSQAGFSQLVVSPRRLDDRLQNAFTLLTRKPSEQSVSGQGVDSPGNHSRPALTTEYVAPQSPIEQTVATAMGDLLGIEKVGIHDNFFELGGHSLLAIQAVTKLRQEFPVDLPMRAFLFEAPTVAGIAKIIQDQVNEIEKTEESSETQATLESLLDQIEDMTPEEVKNEI